MTSQTILTTTTLKLNKTCLVVFPATLAVPVDVDDVVGVVNPETENSKNNFRFLFRESN